MPLAFRIREIALSKPNQFSSEVSYFLMDKYKYLTDLYNTIQILCIRSCREEHNPGTNLKIFINRGLNRFRSYRDLRLHKKQPYYFI